MIKRLIPEFIKTKIKRFSGAPDQWTSFNRIKNQGFEPKIILDIGAYEGHWCSFIHEIFPQAAVLMIEGQDSKEVALQTVSKKILKADYKIALLGAEEKFVDFNIYETASSVLKEHYPTNAKTEQRELTTLRKLLHNTVYQIPDIIKIDTQGYELEILKGGIDIVKNAEVVLLEVSFIDIYKGSPLIIDIINFLNDLNLQCMIFAR